MEKLQKALEKARQERSGRTSRTEQKPVADQDPPRPRHMPASGAWQDLQAYEPDEKFLIDHRVLTLDSTKDATPFDVLRMKMFLLMRQNGWTRVGITSPDQGCGKTTMACNLAVGFSRQTELKSTLFDLDFRLPSIAKLLGITPEHDTIDVLTGKVSAAEQMYRLRSNVAISVSKQAVYDPGQMLLTERTAAVFDAVQEEFEPDVMIFDLPPMLVTEDARAMLQNLDCVLIMAGAEKTKVAQLDTCEREVSEYTQVLGVVLNNCRYMEPDDLYYGTYS